MSMTHQTACNMRMHGRLAGALPSQNAKIGCPRLPRVPRAQCAPRPTAPLLAPTAPPAAPGLLTRSTGRPLGTSLRIREIRAASGEAQGCGAGVCVKRPRRACIANYPHKWQQTHL